MLRLVKSTCYGLGSDKAFAFLPTKIWRQPCPADVSCGDHRALSDPPAEDQLRAIATNQKRLGPNAHANDHGIHWGTCLGIDSGVIGSPFDFPLSRHRKLWQAFKPTAREATASCCWQPFVALVGATTPGTNRRRLGRYRVTATASAIAANLTFSRRWNSTNRRWPSQYGAASADELVDLRATP